MCTCHIVRVYVKYLLFLLRKFLEVRLSCEDTLFYLCRLVGVLSISQKLCTQHGWTPPASSPCYRRSGRWSQQWILHACQDSAGFPARGQIVPDTWWLKNQIKNVTISKLIQNPVLHQINSFTNEFSANTYCTPTISCVLLGRRHFTTNTSHEVQRAGARMVGLQRGYREKF